MFRRRRRRVDQVEEAPTQAQYVREDVVEPPPPPRRPLIWPWLLLLLLLVVGGLALGYFLTRDSNESEVPDVVGLTEPAAVQSLETEGYRAVVTRRPSNAMPAGRVFEQEPDAGSELDEGEPVQIIVAQGPGQREVPNVVGQRVANAITRVQAAGFRVQVREIPSRRGAGVVVRQQPPAGDRARRGSTVVLSVSRGPQLVSVPDLIGQSEAEAGATLARLGLRVNVVRVPSTDAPGTVVAQRPQPGARVPRGTTVRINVSRGAPAPSSRGTVPDVVSQDEQTARTALTSAGFTVRVVDRPTTDPTQDGIVLEQAPPGGTQAPSGSQVVITVGRLSSS